MNRVTINHHLQNHLQPLAYIGSAYYLGHKKMDSITPFLLIGGANAIGTYVARKVRLSCIFGKIVVIGSVFLVSQRVASNPMGSFENPSTLTKTHLLIAFSFSFIDATVLLSKQHSLMLY